VFSENDAVSMHGDPQMSSINDLCDFLRETAFAIHRCHKHGHLEKFYENALAHRLKKAGLNVQQQYPLTVFDEDGTPIGEYFADLIVEDALVVELKACRTLAAEHIAQILGYLRSAKREHGLLMNFGGHRFQIRKYAMNQESVDL
jgi:GxxExxY protein